MRTQKKCYLLFFLVLALITIRCDGATQDDKMRIAGFYSSAPNPSLRTFGDASDGPGKNVGTVYVLILGFDGKYKTQEYQIYDGKAVYASVYGSEMQKLDHGTWHLSKNRVLLKSVYREHVRDEALFTDANESSYISWRDIKYVKREADVIAPLSPIEKWTIDFGDETWKISSCYYATPAEPLIQYGKIDGSGNTLANSQESLVDDYRPYGFETFATPLKLMQCELGQLQLAGTGLNVSSTKVIEDSSQETLYEWWTEDSTVKIRGHKTFLRGAYHLSLLKHDLLWAQKYRLPEGCFYLTYSIPKDQLTEAIKTRWIERLRNAKLK